MNQPAGPNRAWERKQIIPLDKGTARGKNIIIFFSSGAYLGFSPLVPGTVGTLAGVPVYWLLSGLPLVYWALCLIPLTWAAVWFAGRACEIYNVHDDRRVVIDEVIGYAVTTLGAPFSLASVVAGFFIFRFFDILKPWPAGLIDRRLPGGAGVVLDDAAAGVYGALTLQAAMRIWPEIFSM
jgi:phosphatidylglycerophosphatase A